MTHLPAMVPEIQVGVMSMSFIKYIPLIISIPWEQVPSLENSSTVVFLHALSRSPALLSNDTAISHTHWCRCPNHLCISSQAMRLSLKKQLQEWQWLLIFTTGHWMKMIKSQRELTQKADRKPNKPNPTTELLQLEAWSEVRHCAHPHSDCSLTVRTCRLCWYTKLYLTTSLSHIALRMCVSLGAGHDSWAWPYSHQGMSTFGATPSGHAGLMGIWSCDWCVKTHKGQ